MNETKVSLIEEKLEDGDDEDSPQVAEVPCTNTPVELDNNAEKIQIGTEEIIE